MSNQIIKWVDGIIDGMAAIAGLLLVFMMFSICYEVVLRYFLFSPLTWVTEISEYILLYATFLGAPWALKKEAHVKVDIVLARLGFKTQRIVNMATSLIGIGVCLVLVWFGTHSGNKVALGSKIFAGRHHSFWRPIFKHSVYSANDFVLAGLKRCGSNR